MLLSDVTYFKGPRIDVNNQSRGRHRHRVRSHLDRDGDLPQERDQARAQMEDESFC